MSGHLCRPVARSLARRRQPAAARCWAPGVPGKACAAVRDDAGPGAASVRGNNDPSAPHKTFLASTVAWGARLSALRCICRWTHRTRHCCGGPRQAAGRSSARISGSRRVSGKKFPRLKRGQLCLRYSAGRCIFGPHQGPRGDREGAFAADAALSVSRDSAAATALVSRGSLQPAFVSGASAFAGGFLADIFSQCWHGSWRSPRALIHYAASPSGAMILHGHSCVGSEAARGLPVTPIEAPLAVARLRLYWASARRAYECRRSVCIAGLVLRGVSRDYLLPRQARSRNRLPSVNYATVMRAGCCC